MGSDDLFYKRKTKTAQAHGRKKAKQASYDRVLIVCEGQKTEPNYFMGLRRALGLNPANVVIDDRKNGLDPKKLVEYALELYKKDSDFNDVFCVFDKDKHTTYAAALDKIKATRMKPGTKLHPITSIPCFEVWILLHFDYSTAPFEAAGHDSNCALVIRELRKAGRIPEYEKGSLNVYALLAD